MDKPSLSASSFLSLAETFTGFQDNPTGGQNNPTASSGSSINFNGTGTRGATFQINGVNNDDSSENQNRQGAALSTIQEFQVLKNGYSAEFGRGDGAVVLVQTKSGTNQYHGDVYLYQQNGAWNAKSFFAQAAPEADPSPFSEYGFTLGVPGRAEPAVRVRQRRSHEVGRREHLRQGLLHTGRTRGAAADARQRHAGQPRVDPVDPGSLSGVHQQRYPQQPDDGRGVRHQPAG